jgi:hypothetical protein
MEVLQANCLEFEFSLLTSESIQQKELERCYATLGVRI